MKDRKLTIKQRKFADNFIITGNATQSAIDAGYSENTARSIASENLTKPNIQQYIGNQLKKIEQESIADATEVFQFLTSVLRGDIKETEAGLVQSTGEMQSISIPPKIRDRTRAGELLLRRYDIYMDENEKKLHIEKLEAQIEQMKVKTNLLKGVSEDMEDLSDLQGLIYGDEDESD